MRITKLLRWAPLLVFLLAAACGAPPGGGPGPTPGDDDDDDNLPPNSVGCRDINISTGPDGNELDSSAYYTSAIGATTDTSEFIDAQGWQVGGPLELCAGPIENDRAELTLKKDVTFAISLPLSNCLCRNYQAAGSIGTLYCAASSDTLDYTLSIDSNGAAASGLPTIVESGTVPGEGHVRMLFKSAATSIDANAASCTPEACTTALAAESASDVLYTTGTAVAEFLNSVQGGDEAITATGMPFDDDPLDGTADCEDWTDSATALGALAGAPGHDEDNDTLGLQDVVTIERIAE